MLVSNLLEQNKAASLPAVSGKTCLQKYVHQLFDEMSVNEEDGINSSSSKENSAQMMEQVIDPKCIASVAINFSVVANVELLLDETRLRKGEQKSTIVGSSVGSPVASLKMNMSEVVEQLKERRYPTYEPQSEVTDGNFDLLNIRTDSAVNEFELSYVIPNMQNSHDADLIIKFDEETDLNKVEDDDEMVIQKDPSSIGTLGEEMDARKHAEVESLVMIFDSQGTLIGKDNVVAVEENTEPYEPIDRGKGCRTEDPEQVPGKPNVFERVFSVSSSTNYVSETTILSASEHQVRNRELVFLMQTKLSDGDEEGLPPLKPSDLFPPFRFATDLLVPSEVCALKTLILDVNTVAYNIGNCPVKLNLVNDVDRIERNIASKGEIEYLHNLSDKMLTCELQGPFNNLTHVSDILMETEKSWSDNTYLVEKVKNQIVDIWMESLMVAQKLPSPESLDQFDAMNCPHVACGYSPIRNASKISVEEHIGLLIVHFGGKSYTIRNALVGELEKLVVKDFNDMEIKISSKTISPLTEQAMLKGYRKVLVYTMDCLLQSWAELCREHAFSIGADMQLLSAKFHTYMLTTTMSYKCCHYTRALTDVG